LKARSPPRMEFASPPHFFRLLPLSEVSKVNLPEHL
jgi:hypothetical protein